ncbi:hypothetical protein NP493_3942g00000 [Ridgeia piscesae]|uniref:Uncharacterized protein n=1 Tax=Ridgeia piscesae TaxID=27915 RepID=A0AAD9J2P7_RIDPI|nr:hypothetical protein NP493_3942g00000 [Ridgeia piscesae]
MTAIPFHCALEAPVSDYTQWSLSFQFRRCKNQRNIRARTHIVDGLVQVVSSKMAAVRLYVTLAVLLFATCLHTSEGWFSPAYRPCYQVHCRWLSWSSWGSCNSDCSWTVGVGLLSTQVTNMYWYHFVDSVLQYLQHAETNPQPHELSLWRELVLGSLQGDQHLQLRPRTMRDFPGERCLVLSVSVLLRGKSTRQFRQVVVRPVSDPF